MTDTTPRLLPDDTVATLEDHLALGGGDGLATAVDIGPEETIRRVTDSGLRGRGGAGFPTGRKWDSVRSSADDGVSEVYLVANAAEGEPGTYKDRALIERNPFAFVEGMCIAMHAIGATRGVIGIKERFTDQVARLEEAVEQALAADWPYADRIELVLGPDEYLFGEETAMLEVAEGRLPMPRILAPYERGLFSTTTIPNPTVVNNVETLSHVAWILAKGPEWFREVGTDDSPGTMLFTVTGDVANAGVYEVPLGTSLRTLLEDIAGAEDVMAVFGGASNAVITRDMLDLPLDFDALNDAGTGLGSGGFVVYDGTHCIVAVLAALSRFLAIESCGQCLACKLGTGRITELLETIDAGEGTETHLQEILQRSIHVTDANRCYLPVGEQEMVTSVLERFGDAFREHLGTPCTSEREVVVPKIEHIDHDTGEVTFDPDYHRKRPDWSYADEDGNDVGDTGGSPGASRPALS